MIIVFFLALALLLVLLLRFLYRRNWDKGLRTSIVFSASSCRPGDEVSLVERTVNHKRLPLPLYSHSYDVSRSFGSITVRRSSSFGLGGRSVVEKRIPLGALERGIYSVGNGRVEVGDLFSASSFSSPVDFSSRHVVFPLRLGREEFRFPYRELLGTVLNNSLSQEDPFEIRGIRPYQSYDPMKTINWKASARTGSLKVNLRSYTTDEGVFLILDLEKAGEEGEFLISFASTLASSLLSRGVGVEFLTNGRSCFLGRKLSLEEGSGAGHSAAIDTVLSEIKLSLGVSEGTLSMLEGMKERPLHNLPVIVTPGLDADEASLFQTMSHGEGVVLSLGPSDGGCRVIRIGGRDEE